MARMIPSVISPEVKSTAERRVFDWFKCCKGTENWIVLHSLGIANHSRVIYGEIDFFVLAPGLGLFALEVKGGRVSRKEGVWEFTNKYNKTERKNRGPFDQAWEGVYSIVREIKSKLDGKNRHLNRLFFGIGVMFPDIEYKVSGSDELQWQVFDINDGSDVYSFIKRLSSGASEQYVEKLKHPVPKEGYMNVDDVNNIASLLRGDFDRAVALSVIINTAEVDMISLTKEQYGCIDQLEDNPRCLIRGGAGTGKTLIAAEEVTRSVANKQKVALFCYNNTLGRWLSNCFSNPELRPQYVGTFHKFLTDTLSKNGISYTIPQDDNSQQLFYQETLPNLALDILRNTLDKFDLLIIDEAQDLISMKYLDVLDATVIGGLTRGRWRMFGDFSRQAIYSGTLSSEDMLAMLNKRTSYSNFKLTINCRNTKPIGEEICTVSGYEPPNDIWMKVDGPPVNYVTFSNADEGCEQLQQIIEDLIGSGISSKKITILSPVKRESSIIGKIEKVKIANYKAEGNETINFSTIHSFKGLENTIIIITDITNFSDTQLMYVAFSRAVAGLYVLTSKEAAMDYLSLKSRRFIK